MSIVESIRRSSALDKVASPTMGSSDLIKKIGTGVATENKLLSSKECYFQVIELFPLDSNELKSDTDTLKHSGVDAKGTSYSVEVKFGKSIKAVWLPSDSNRVTAPDLRRGDRVEVYRLADSDQYYWRSMGLDTGVRRLETVASRYSNTKDESVKELDETNSWTHEISTHNKTVTLHTTKSDGEEFEYTIQLNVADGVFMFTDHENGQRFESESRERRWRIANADGSEVLMDKTKLKLTAPDEIELNTKVYKLNASESVTVDTEEYKDKSTNYTNTSTNYKVTTSTLSVNYGNGTYSGSTGFSGTLKNNGVNVGSTHKHGGVAGGISTTLTPM